MSMQIYINIPVYRLCRFIYKGVNYIYNGVNYIYTDVNYIYNGVNSSVKWFKRGLKYKIGFTLPGKYPKIDRQIDRKIRREVLQIAEYMEWGR